MLEVKTLSTYYYSKEHSKKLIVLLKILFHFKKQFSKSENMKKLLFCFLTVFIIGVKSFGQNDPVLFTVNGAPVLLSEFNYIYTKTNGNKADFTRASVDEYLDLYTKFKMKVARAKDMRLDTIASLKEELAGYRRQLADSYLTDKEVTDKLVKEAYDRIQKDMSISHILFKIERNDTLAAYTQARIIKTKLDNGSNFESLAKEVSQDVNSQKSGGYLGFLTAILPDGFYALENAIYKTPVGKTSDIVRSPLGYHILKINAERPARGEMEAAHIMIRKTKEGVDQPFAKQRIDSIYQALKKGGNFETLAQTLSDDGNSAQRGGYLGLFGIGRYELAFEDAAFNLAKDGDFSQPIESSIGWHIIKRLNRKGIESMDVMKSRLKARIQQDGRFELAKQAMVERIKRENNFKEDPSVLRAYISALDSTFLTFSWKNPTNLDKAELFKMGTKSITTNDFSTHLVINANRRLSYGAGMKNDLGQMTRALYDEYVVEQALAFEETQLEKKYSDFKNLMREYEEGILLFEAIKMNVWDKASLDTVGLEKFHNAHKDKYKWDERAQVITYFVGDSVKSELDNIRSFAEKNSTVEVLKKFNKKKEILSFSEDTAEKGKSKSIESIPFKVGSMTKTEQNPADKTWHFMKIERIMPAGMKSLKEARGFVVADYQEFLEKQWMNELSAKYKVKIEDKVLNSIIK